MADLLARVSAENHSPHRTYAARLLAATQDESGEPVGANLSSAAPPVQLARAAAWVEPLTERELEVLRWIAAGLSNGQIARRLAIEVSTVKRHVNHIFGKLGVTTRTQALVRAKELSLL